MIGVSNNVSDEIFRKVRESIITRNLLCIGVVMKYFQDDLWIPFSQFCFYDLKVFIWLIQLFIWEFLYDCCLSNALLKSICDALFFLTVINTRLVWRRPLLTPSSSNILGKKWSHLLSLLRIVNLNVTGTNRIVITANHEYYI